MTNLNKIYEEALLVINQEMERNDALNYQIEYLKKRASIQRFKPATGEMREKQLNNLTFALGIIDTIQKENFNPFLSSGALIGAVRHKGFVPWDNKLDFTLMADEFWRLQDFIKENYVWVDSSTKIRTTSYWAFLDEAFKQYPNQIFGMRTPYCMHLYKGTCLEDCCNIEFLPYYYFKESVTENEYKKHAQSARKIIEKAPHYGMVYQFYDEMLKDYSLTCSDSNKIAAGINHNSLTDWKYMGFFEKSTIFPLKTIEFEGHQLPTLNDPHTYLSMVYGDYMSLPNDVGISPLYSDMNRYLATQNRKLNFPEAAFY